jgi:hypothetical protein
MRGIPESRAVIAVRNAMAVENPSRLLEAGRQYVNHDRLPGAPVKG